MSHWNYRIIKDDTGFTIREVYYNDDDIIFGWSQEPDYSYGETIDELLGDFELMVKAFKAPILYLKDGELKECSDMY